jgi:hypothetical protein
VRDGAGQDHNALYFYALAAQQSLEMPFFGKNPVWSPEGTHLVGSRLKISERQPPQYELWMVTLASGEEVLIGMGCDPQWSADGRWLAYNGHSDAQWQGYTDCFANGQVIGYSLLAHENVFLTANLERYFRLVGWLPPADHN